MEQLISSAVQSGFAVAVAELTGAISELRATIEGMGTVDIAR